MPPTASPSAATLRLDLQQWEGLQWHRGAQRLSLRDCRVQQAAIELHAGRPAAVEVGTLTVEGLALQGRAATAGLARTLRRSAAATAEPPTLDALRASHGQLQSFVTDAAWILDATVTLPVREGCVDFDEVGVAHLGPDSAMGLSAGGLYVDTPQFGRRFLYVFTGGLPAGVQLEQRQGRSVADRGALDLVSLLATLLQGNAPAPAGHWANDDARAAALLRSRVTGELQLGDGLLQALGLALTLCGHAIGANRVALSSARLDEGLLLRLPQVSAQALRADVAGWRAQAQRLEAQASLQLDGGWTRDEPVAFTLELPRLVVHGLRAEATAVGPGAQAGFT